MKKIFIILLLSSFALFGQEPIYNINPNNLHLLNYANYEYDTFYVNLDNSYEFYNNDKQFNSTNLNLNFDFENKIQLGINSEYNYLGNNNNNFNFDGILKYKYSFNEDFNIVFAGNIGFINSNIDYSTLESRYSNEELTSLDIAYNKQNLNLGFGATFNYLHTFSYLSIMEAGVYFNHLNSASLPLNNDKIPIKYTAFIRNRFGQFSSLLTYAYQDNFYYNPKDFDYYYSMLNYIGANINYLFYFPLDIGLGYKYLSNNSNMYSVSASYLLGRWKKEFSIFYSFSLLDMKTNNPALLHQLGVYFHFSNSIYRTGGFL